MSGPPYTLIRSRRRTIALIVTPEATLTVRAPTRVPLPVINDFIHRHVSWIQRTMDRMRARPAPAHRQFIEGEMMMFLGVSYPLTIVEVAKRPLTFSKKTGFMLRRKDVPRARALYEAWYRKEALIYIRVRTGELAAAHSLEYRSITITGARRRWGSCSSQGTLNFSWRSILAPALVVDYVIAHELAHLKHLNHSKRFWRFVEEIDPKYARARSWLTTHGHTLVL